MLSDLPPVPEFLQPMLGSSARAAQIFYGVLALLALSLLLLLWLRLGSGPRRRRRYQRARRLLQQGAWPQALEIAQQMQLQRLSVREKERWQKLQGECHRAAGLAAIGAKNYEAGLEQSLAAARLLQVNETEVRRNVIGAMLEEVRRLFAATSGKDTAGVHELIRRVFVLEEHCLEATFWQALCRIREGHPDKGIADLQTARAREGDVHLDPLLYLGALLLRAGEPKEALRHLTEANRLDRNCPLVTWQLSTAMLAAGHDAAIAVRALQRVLGPQGLLLWTTAPERFWVEAFPEGRSFVRLLASRHPYTCPLWGKDPRSLIPQAQTTLADGLYRLGKYQEAADLFEKVAQQTAPSRVVLRGLGMALARLERYDEAFKHLRTAHDLEEKKDRWTTGYLALSGARARPLRPEDKEKNILWAMRLLTRFTGPGDPEWAQVTSKLFAEARTASLPQSLEDQLYLCEHLVSVHATDAEAAEGYRHLAATFPASIRSEYAWLYCRAAQQHNLHGAQTLELFARTFQEQAAARTFFQEQHWDFDELEFYYLQNAAAQQPGAFPQTLGLDYPARGERFLQERSLRLENAGNLDGARTAAEVWLKLAPQSAAAHDRLAYLAYQQGDFDQAQRLLSAWQALEPENYLPLLRQAVIYHQREDTSQSHGALRRALHLAQDPSRAGVAFLGARLALQGASPDWRLAEELLVECLHRDPRHLQAQWCLAALRAVHGQREALASLAASLKQPEVTEPRFHLVAAVCHLAAGDYNGVIDACQRAAADPALAVESAYLMGWNSLYRKDPGTAALTLRRTAENAESPSAAHAQALLAGLRFYQGDYDEAIYWWNILAPEQRARWKLNEPLQQTVLLSALKSLEAGQFEAAAVKIREAAKLGLRDRRLGPLLTLALVKAGQGLMFSGEPLKSVETLESGGGRARLLPSQGAGSAGASPSQIEAPPSSLTPLARGRQAP